MRTLPLLTLALSACLPEFPGKTYAEDPSHDFDGDGVTEADGDCDDTDARAVPGAVWYRDADGDLYGDPTVSTVACTIPAGFVAEGGDCDDAISGVHPGAPETCTPYDDDCDGSLTVPEGAAVPTWHVDADADGFGATGGESRTQCDQPAGFVYDASDCDDARADVRPRAPERCDGRDNDCDGATDDADPDASDRYTWYADTDGDGFGASDSTTQSCDAPAGFVEGAGDCDDTRADVSPGAEEACDGVDQDCDGRVDDGVQGTFYADLDADGFGDPAGTAVEACSAPAGMTEDFTDCDDLDPDSFPGATETCDDADNDCDGRTDEAGALGAATWYADADADGYGDRDTPFAACTQPASYVAVAGDCNDGRADVSPAATESCRTGFDDDCDGDENDIGAIGCTTFWPDADADGFGDAASSGACTCTASAAYPARDAEDCDDARATVNPDQLEDCGTGYDDDCDADANDAGAAGCAYFYVDVDGDGFGDDALPDAASCTCEGAGYLTATVEGDCDDTDVRVSPAQSEVCGGGDEDCSGAVDDDAIDATRWYRDSDGDRFGDSASSRLSCTTPAGYASVGADCDDGRSGVYPGRTEDCLTTFDDDCSGSDNDVGADACTTFYADADSDGYGVTSDRTCTCEADTSTVYTSRITGDCLDTNAGVSPGDVELCSTTGIDDDCDGTADEENASGCTNYFYDYDGDGYGTSTNRCLCSTSGYYTAAALGDCNDSDSTMNPRAMNCGLLGTVSTSSAAAVITGRTVSNTAYYNSITSLDYDRDGNADIVLGSSGETSTYSNAGAVYLWLGPVTGSRNATPAGGAAMHFIAPALNRAVGTYVTAADVDGDGYDEIAVSSGSGTESYLLDDGLTGLGSVTPSTPGVVTFSAHRTLVTFDDVNGDGYDDGLLGSYGAYMAYGSPTGLVVSSSDRISVSYGEDVIERATGFRAVISVGDINGDGSADLLTKRPYGEFSSYLVAYEGGVDWDAVADSSMRITASYQTRQSAQNIGDVNGDGYGDMMVSDVGASSTADPYTGAALDGAGRVWLFSGGSAAGTVAFFGFRGSPAESLSDAVWTLEGTSLSQGLGMHAATAGDVDADSCSDLTISSRVDGASDSRTSLWYGPLNFSGNTYLASEADATFATPGVGLAAAGDVNADGYDDIWMGHDSVWLFHGTPR